MIQRMEEDRNRLQTEIIDTHTKTRGLEQLGDGAEFNVEFLRGGAALMVKLEKLLRTTH